VPIVGFPRGATGLLDRYINGTAVDGVSCDTACPMSVMQKIAQSGKVVQGNLDPLLLATGGMALDVRVDKICDAMKGLPFVFNLGHGIVPDTPPEYVARLVERLRMA
jgi:uroporphyrinogen decarboxylase